MESGEWRVESGELGAEQELGLGLAGAIQELKASAVMA
jgi:hypothetical protein